MSTYLLRRFLQTIGLLFILSILLFTLVNLAPGGPLAGQGQSRHISPEKVELLKRQFGLDKPLPTQYLVWLVGNDWMRVDADGDGVFGGHFNRRPHQLHDNPNVSRVYVLKRKPYGNRVTRFIR